MTGRVAANGKHLFLDGEPYRVKGVTYGGFVEREDGYRFPERHRIDADLAAMAEVGLNTVRVYDIPPKELLEIAAKSGLRLIVGLGEDLWQMEQGVTRAARQRISQAGRLAVREAMSLCAGRSEVMAIAVGNEVPVDLIRIHGADRVAHVFSELIAEVHHLDPEMMATYVNFPTTEFLDPEGQDFACFNVFLEDEASFRRYIRHLQIVSAARPLVITEVGLAAEIHGEEAQSDLLRNELRVLDEEGVAGASVYAWTDEWAVNNEPVTGWGFGITDMDRRPKIALGSVNEWCDRSTDALRDQWAPLTVVVCAYNEEQTIGACLDSLVACTYPDLEVIVCDDGSTDRTADIAQRYPFKLLQLPHGGLSRARNAGIAAARGDIVAYLDADAACHPEWPFHLVLSLDTDASATGGPNLPSPEAGFIERAVSLSPGGPTEVLVSNDRAEHVPGCNMAFRRDALESIGGFDVAYTTAGDDVDVCWKLLDGGGQIAFSPAAQVWHRRRSTVRGYLKQQRGYGRAERMLSGPHRARFNRLGHATWKGFIYGGSRILPSLLRPVVYHGWQGQAPFQPITKTRSSAAAVWAGSLLPLLLVPALAGIALALVSPRWLILSAAAAALIAAYGAAIAAAVQVDRSETRPTLMRLAVGVLHVMQPFARLWGRASARPLPHTESDHQWRGEDRSDWLEQLAAQLRSSGALVREGGPADSWDIRITVGPMAIVRITVAVVWGWEPRRKARYAVQPLAYAALMLSVPIAVFSTWLGVAVAATTVLWTVAEMLRLRSKVTSAVAATTAVTVP
jgi:glycosyltransferase involved in cell wall biosynthesis